MAENPNIPGGAIPPRPSEAPKVQPRKETVRINLPPKPTAGGASSATIKLPTLPAATQPAPFTAAPPPAVGVPPPAAAAPRPPSPPAAPGAKVAAPPARSTAAAPAPPGPPVKRAPVAPAGKASVGTVDLVLGWVAAVAGLAALGVVVYLGWGLPTHPGL